MPVKLANSMRVWCTIQSARGYQQGKRMPNAHQLGKHEGVAVWVLSGGALLLAVKLANSNARLVHYTVRSRLPAPAAAGPGGKLTDA